MIVRDGNNILRLGSEIVRLSTFSYSTIGYIPIMSSNTEPSPFGAWATYNNDNAYQAFDGDTYDRWDGTRWRSSGETETLGIILDKKIAIYKWKIRSINYPYSSTWAPLPPATFTLKTGDDTILDKFTQNSNVDETRIRELDVGFIFSNEYKIVYQNDSDDFTARPIIYEFQIYQINI